MPLKTAPPARVGADSVDGTQRKVCAVCGQAYDAFDFGQYYHHSDKPHAPQASGKASPS